MTGSAPADDPRFREAAELLDEGARDGAYSAAVLLAGRGEDVLWEKTAGYARPDSVFDVASLTKPLTAALFFLLCQEGRLSPEGPVSSVLPFSSPDPRVRGVRFLHLLSHTSGLPAYLPLHEKVLEAEKASGRPVFGTAEGHDRIIAEVLSLSLKHDPGSAWEYSDLGYMLLGRAVEAAGFDSLDRMLKSKLCGPLGMRDTRFLPLAAMGEDGAARIVPTGRSEVRQIDKAGEVDDENAAAMGGVAGHAGIFSTASDLFLFARELLRARKGEGRVLSRASAEAMTARVSSPPGCPRTPGFDTPTQVEGGASSPKGDSPGETPRSQAGSLAPPDAVGHLGFTGCSLWIDPGREIPVVLLTNRVVFGSDNRKLSSLRPGIHDAVWRGMAG